MKTISDVLQALKARLKEREKSFYWVDSWCGNTETGFYDQAEFDMEKLLNEIDQFGEDLRNRKVSP